MKSWGKPFQEYVEKQRVRRMWPAASGRHVSMIIPGGIYASWFRPDDEVEAEIARKKALTMAKALRTAGQ